MIKVKVNNEYKDVVKIFCGGTLQKEITKVWSREAQDYVYESSVEYTGTLPITINANGDALLDYRIYGADGGVGEPTENLIDASLSEQTVEIKPSTSYAISRYVDPPGQSASDLKFGVYDENDVLLWNDYLGTWLGENIRVYDNAKYFKIKIPNRYLNAVSLVEGTRPAELGTRNPYPENYIPYGYKLPMTVYKQEFMVTSDMLDQSNWVFSPHYDFAPPYFIYFDISDSISNSECDVKIYKNFTQNYVSQLLVVALTDGIYMTVDISYRILNNKGVTLNKKFDFSSWDKIYLCIGYGYGYKNESDKQLKINELFENWKILIAPTSQTQDTPAYIGENQLDAGEYVSYGEQKIYRDVDGTLTPTDPPVPLPEIPTIDGETVIDYDGEPKPSQMYVKYRR